MSPNRNLDRRGDAKGALERLLLRAPAEKLPALQHQLVEAGGWRGIFDSAASEWNRSEPPAKTAFLFALMTTCRVRLGEVLVAYKRYWKEHQKRADVAHDADFTCMELLEGMILLEHSDEMSQLVKRAKGRGRP